MPSARSSESAPVDTASIAIDPRSPIRMMEPLPNCLSICESAISSALSRSVLMVPFPLLLWDLAVLTWGLSPTGRCGDLSTTVERGCDSARRE